MPFFSVVVPTYNAGIKLKDTIESVLNQTFDDFELLIMDDGSIDDTKTLVESFSDSRIKYEWKPNSGGPATPRNRGLIASSAPWVSFLDADDIWHPRKLEIVNTSITDKNKSKIGFLTLPFLYSMGNFGYGFHVGSSFPMSKTPKGRQSDIYGRPYGLKKIHIVDASIFPSIPASTITYTVMANSYRIGDLYADYKDDN